MLFNSWFNPSRYKILGFKTQKSPLLFNNVLLFSAFVCFSVFSIKAISACCWKFWVFFVEMLGHQNWGLWFSIFLMIIQADVDRSFTFSNELKLTDATLEQINKVFTFACKVVKYLKGFFCPVTFECFCLLQLFTTNIVHSWEVWWTMTWFFWLFDAFTYKFVLKDVIASY